MTPDKWPLFTKMGRVGTHFRKKTGFTKTFLVFGAVDTAVARTNRAGLKPLFRISDFLLEESIFVGFEINRTEVVGGHFYDYSICPCILRMSSDIMIDISLITEKEIIKKMTDVSWASRELVFF